MSVMARLTGDWQRVAQRVVDRRGQLDMTQEDVQEAGGPSVATLRLIESAGRDTFQSGVVGRLEKVLQWQPGSVRAILAGGEPTEVGAPAAGTQGPQDMTAAELAALVDSDPELARAMLEVFRLARRRRDEQSVEADLASDQDRDTV